MKPKPVSSHWALAECQSFTHPPVRSALVPGCILGAGESRVRRFLFLKKYFYLFLAVLGLPCYGGFSLVVLNGVYSLVMVGGLLTVVPPLFAEHRL